MKPRIYLKEYQSSRKQCVFVGLRMAYDTSLERKLIIGFQSTGEGEWEGRAMAEKAVNEALREGTMVRLD